jgi:hypothetical protein
MKIVEIFNEIFSPMIFLHFADIFCWLCVLIFDIATRSVCSYKELMSTLAMNVPHALFMICFLCVTIKSAENVMSEAKKCINLLHEIVNSNYCENKYKQDVRSEVFQLGIQIITLPVKFSCGLIDFDWKSLFKVRF